MPQQPSSKTTRILPALDNPVSVAAMQAIDLAAIESIGIPRVVLMDHAGLAVAHHATQMLGDENSALPIVICCGSGYNGGDGFSAARHLHNWGFKPQIVLAGRLENLREEPKIFAHIARQLDIPIIEYNGQPEVSAIDTVRQWLGKSGVIVDALLGLGAQGSPRQPLDSLIRLINAAARPIIAVDVPSGMDADTGIPHDTAIKAQATVTFGRIKQGCISEQGKLHCGRMIVEPITFPRKLLKQT